MTDIPKLGGFEDRCSDCRTALEPMLEEVTRHAMELGWDQDEIAYALLEIARANIKTLIRTRRASANGAQA